jgi:hypothetical protein
MQVTPGHNFEVTLIGDDDTDQQWRITAASPENALTEGLHMSQGQPGIYSVWDSSDLFGMPVLEYSRSAS